jgi:transposase
MREVVNACFYLEHTGCQWRALPSDFGPHQTVRTWYDRFRADGVWSQADADLTRRVREAHGHALEPTTGILDSQSVVSGPQPGERGFDGNKKVKGIKRHVLSCSLGFILAVIVTPANVHDTKAAEMVLDWAVENGFTIKRATDIFEFTSYTSPCSCWRRCPAGGSRGVRPCRCSSPVASARVDPLERTFLELRRSAVFRRLARHAIDRDTGATKRRFVCCDGLGS